MANIDGVLNGVLKVILPAAAIAAAALAVIAVTDHMAADGLAAERRALLTRSGALDRSAIVPGSALACLDSGPGEAVQNACEKAVFADARSVAAAVAYTSARLALLRDAFDLAQRGDAGVLGALAGARRAIELDRYGFAAHVLSQRDGCTVERCAAFDMLRDTAALKSNMKARVFDAYVDRHAGSWDKVVPQTAPPPVAAASPAPDAEASVAPVASAAQPPAAVGRPVDSRWDFPSAASIPPVSIMNSEPKLPTPAAEAKAAPPAGEASASTVPVPPRRPQAEATSPVPVR